MKPRSIFKKIFNRQKWKNVCGISEKIFNKFWRIYVQIFTKPSEYLMRYLVKLVGILQTIEESLKNLRKDF